MTIFSLFAKLTDFRLGASSLKEELDSISLFMSYSLSIEPDREDVRERISRERAPAPGVASGQDKALVDMEGSS